MDAGWNMRHRKSRWLTAVLSLSLVLSGVGLAPGQDDDQPLRTPRNNVRGGQVAARSPSLWTTAARGRHIEFQNRALSNFGGGIPIPEDEVPPSPGEVFRIEFLSGALDVVNQLASQFRLLLQASRVAVQAAAAEDQ